MSFFYTFMNARRLLYFCFIPAFCGILSACEILGSGPCIKGKGNVSKESKDVTAFTGVDVRLPGTVYINYGLRHEVQVETYSNIQPEIITEVVGTSLVIRSESCLEFFTEEATFFVTIPVLESVELKSSAEVKIQGVTSAQKLRLNLSGSGTIYYTGSNPQLTVLHSGSGDVVLVGQAIHLETTLSGSGRVQGFSLATETAKTVLAGSGYQQVWVQKELDATITGSGNIFYRGSPEIVKYTPGSGKLINSN